MLGSRISMCLMDSQNAWIEIGFCGMAIYLLRFCIGMKVMLSILNTAFLQFFVYYVLEISYITVNNEVGLVFGQSCIWFHEDIYVN